MADVMEHSDFSLLSLKKSLPYVFVKVVEAEMVKEIKLRNASPYNKSGKSFVINAVFMDCKKNVIDCEIWSKTNAISLELSRVYRVANPQIVGNNVMYSRSGSANKIRVNRFENLELVGADAPHQQLFEEIAPVLEYVAVADTLLSGKALVNVKCVVVVLGDREMISTVNGETNKRSIVIADGSGAISATVWGDDFDFDGIIPFETVVDMRNMRIDLVRGCLVTGKRSVMNSLGTSAAVRANNGCIIRSHGMLSPLLKNTLRRSSTVATLLAPNGPDVGCIKGVFANVLATNVSIRCASCESTNVADDWKCEQCNGVVSVKARVEVQIVEDETNMSVQATIYADMLQQLLLKTMKQFADMIDTEQQRALRAWLNRSVLVSLKRSELGFSVVDAAFLQA